MKIIKTIISVVFAAGTIALIIYDTQTRKPVATVARHCEGASPEAIPH